MNVKRHFAHHSIFVFGLFAILTSTVAKPSFSLSPPSLPSFAALTQEYVGRKHAAQMKNYRCVDQHIVLGQSYQCYRLLLFAGGWHFDWRSSIDCCRSVNIIPLLSSFKEVISIRCLFYYYLQWYPATERFFVDDLLS